MVLSETILFFFFNFLEGVVIELGHVVFLTLCLIEIFDGLCLLPWEVVFPGGSGNFLMGSLSLQV